MKKDAFIDPSKWWVYRSADGTGWEVSAPAGNGACIYEFPTGAEALAAFAKGGRR
ncbi:hypothetical protein SEA_PIPER2020_66 [Mycobacterium phage Piper2020]|nr:hypothetical protein SEA_MISHA28_63 [Mycobacterium phage Misha28]AVP42452.1 hypothetical protein SEA_TOOTSIEPOP_63 [Mycobacterium phage TootsiePop]QBP31745.1 hypothetical protein SEA_PIPER2020_66 [Mycobacterium phage Piper2020]QKO03248.1 hypothetical protein SEA_AWESOMESAUCE_65 [Mycobacterium phage Awesomesauce]